MSWLDRAETLRLDPAAAFDVESLARQLGFRHPDELEHETRRHFHASATDLLLAWRLDAVRRRLVDTARSPSELAADFGFAEEASFEESFRRRFLISAESFRDLRGRREWSLELPAWWRQQDVVGYWGRDPSSRHETASAERLRWAINSPEGPIGLGLRLPSRPGKYGASVELFGAVGKNEGLASWAHLILIRLLGLHDNPESFENQTLEGDHRRLVASRRGLVIPQTASVFDGIAWVVCGQQVSLPVAFKLRRGLADRFGRPVGDLLAPPTASDLASSSEGELFALGFSRRKEEYLRGIARDIVGTEQPSLDVEGWRHRSAVEIEERLLAVRGFGPWSVNYLRMRSFGLADCVPVGDAALARALQHFFGLEARPKAEETQSLMRPFAPYRSLASFHFWASLKDGSG